MKRIQFYCILLTGVGLVLIASNLEPILNSLLDKYHVQIEQELSKNLPGKIRIGKIHLDGLINAKLQAHPVVFIPQDQAATRHKLDYINLNFDFSELLQGKVRLDEIAGGCRKTVLRLSKKSTIFSNLSFRLYPQYRNENLELLNLEASADLGSTRISGRAESVLYSKNLKNIAVNNANLVFGSNNISLTGELNLASSKYNATSNNFKIDAQQLGIASAKFGINTLKYVSRGEIAGSLNISGNSNPEISLTGKVHANKLKVLEGGSFETIAAQKLKINFKPNDLQIDTELTVTNAAWKSKTSSYFVNQAKGPVKLNLKQHEVLANLQLGTKAFRLVNNGLTVGPISGTIRNGTIKNNEKQTDINLDIQAEQLELLSKQFSIRKTASATANLSISLPAKGNGFQLTTGILAKDSQLNIFNKNLNVRSGNFKLIASDSGLKVNTSDSIIEYANNQGKLKLDYQDSNNKYEIKNLWTDCLGGNFTFMGKASSSSKENLFNLKINSSNNNLNRVLAALEIEPKNSNKLEAIVKNFNLTLSGDFNNLVESLRGLGDLQIYQDHAERGGLISKLTSALTVVPLVGGLFNYLKEGKQQISHTFSTNFSIADKQVLFSKAKLSQQRFNIEGSGNLKFDGLLALKGDVIVLQETAGDLALGIPGLSQLFRRVGRIKIPIQVKGKLPDYDVQADIPSFLKEYSGYNLGSSILSGVGSVIKSPLRLIE